MIAKIDAAGGMYKAVETGLVQTMIGDSALAFQERVDSGEHKIVGLNCYQTAENQSAPPAVRPDAAAMDRHIELFKAFKRDRGQEQVARALVALARAANSTKANVFERVVEAVEVGVTHGEVIACLRRELGFGHPLILP